jgi:hypothetical protein
MDSDICSGSEIKDVGYELIWCAFLLFEHCLTNGAEAVLDTEG